MLGARIQLHSRATATMCVIDVKGLEVVQCNVVEDVKKRHSADTRVSDSKVQRLNVDTPKVAVIVLIKHSLRRGVSRQHGSCRHGTRRSMENTRRC